jgi:hypothetical protein
MRLSSSRQNSSFWSGSVALALLLGMAVGGSAGVQAQTTRRATLPNPVDAPICSISEFRTLALSTHDPMERTELATQWLRADAVAADDVRDDVHRHLAKELVHVDGGARGCSVA